jgi:hypothetical protein
MHNVIKLQNVTHRLVFFSCTRPPRGGSKGWATAHPEILENNTF